MYRGLDNLTAYLYGDEMAKMQKLFSCWSTLLCRICLWLSYDKILSEKKQENLSLRLP